MAKTVAVIDGNSLMHRAYHAVPPTMNAPDGTPTNAVFGFLSMLLKFIDVAQPDAIVCAFDAGLPAFRKELLEQYKAQRPHMDDELRRQFPLIENLLAAMNVPVVKLPGWEGDDILGTVAARDEQLGYRTLLVTGDRDAYQLATDLTHIVTTKKGITDVAIYGPAEVVERYGVRPDQVPDYLGLKGDSSDNIPGVRGIGEKTAAKLLQAYGSLEGIYEHIDELKGRQKENLLADREAAFASRTVATIVRDVEFPLDLEGTVFPSFDPACVSAAFGEVGLTVHLGRVLALAQGTEAGGAVVLATEPIVRGDEARALVDAAIGRDEMVGVAVVEPDQASLFDTGLNLAVNTSEGTAAFEDDRALAVLARLVEAGRFAAVDVKRLVQYVFPPDTSVRALVDEPSVVAMRAFDLGLAGYVLDSSRASYPLEELFESYGGGALPEAKGGDDIAAVQAAAARALVEPLTEALARDGATGVYFDIDLPLVGVLAAMERTGAALDAAQLNSLGRQTQADIDELRGRIYALAGHEFNVDSPQQLSRVLFDELGYPHGKKTQRGYSTDASVLKELARDHELPGLVLRYRELAKIKSTYIDALPNMCAGDGRVHTSFNETVTATGRLSSSDPNLQNIPVRTDFGRQIRACFVPLAEGEYFLSADYSQIELRLLAHLSADEHLVAAFCSGMDFHATTASRVFGVPVDQVTPQQRSRAKAVNFGIVYGQQAFGLSQSLGIPFGEARDMIDRYFEAYPGVRRYLDEVVAQARERGYAETMYGRRRHIPELRSTNANQRGFGERTAMNHPMQGSAADIIKRAMSEVQRRMVAEGFRAKLMLQVHDELDFSVPLEEVEPLGAMVREAMESVAVLRVPLVVDVSSGATWAEAH